MNGTQSGKSFIFIWGLGVIVTFSIVRFCLSDRTIKLEFSIIDWLILIYVFYIVFRNKWTDLDNSLLFFELIGLTTLYFILRRQPTAFTPWILIATIIGGIIQSGYGNLQLWGYFPSHHSLFRMTGSFFNPGPYAGYLSAIFPVTFGLLLFDIRLNIIPLKEFYTRVFCKLPKVEKEQKSKLRIPNFLSLKSLYWISIVSIGLVLPASRSRAAWIAALVSSIYLLSVKFKLIQVLKSHLRTCIKKISLLFFLVIFVITTLAGIYFLKKDSADGRLLIWEISSKMIKEKPVFGYGYDGFKKHYMDFQAKYFENNPADGKALVAGDTSYAFNELIQTTVENGLLGILPVLVIIYLVFIRNTGYFHRRQIKNRASKAHWLPQFKQIPIDRTECDQNLFHISRAVILSIIVFGLFSYPLQILPIKICLIVALAIAAENLNQTWMPNLHLNLTLNKEFISAFKIIISTVSFWGLATVLIKVNSIKTAYIDWKDAYDQYNYGIYQECLSDYSKAYPFLKANGDFLTNYGKALSMAGKNTEAISILNLASQYYPNIVVFTALGDSYSKLGRISQAETAYLHAWYMNPSRFYPKYLLAKLYNETGQREKAVSIAKELLKKQIKIESTAIEEIKIEMKAILNNNKDH